MEQPLLPGLEFQKKQVFKKYDTRKIDLLYFQNIGSLIPNNHIARLINILVDNMDLENIYKKYKGGGTSAYDPKMLLKVWLLGYVEKIFTSRKLHKALKENIVFMWISGRQFPDFRTLNNFRNLLEDDIKDIFKTTVESAMTLKMIDGKTGNIDGTIIDANTNKHKVIWQKSIEKGLTKIENELNKLTEEIFEESKKLQTEEDEEYKDEEIKDNELNEEIKIKKVLNIVGNINNKLKSKKKKTDEEKELLKKAKRVEVLKDREKKYKEKEKKLDGKNSYAKHDEDAPAKFNKQGIIRPGYTEVVVSQNQIVLDYETSNKGERVLLKDAVKNTEKNTNVKLEKLVGDGGFGSEENYEFLEKENIDGYIRYNRYYKEKDRKWNQEKIRKESFKKINESEYTCINGKILKHTETNEEINKYGYKTVRKTYEANPEDCKNCKYKKWCTNAERRTISFSEQYERLRNKAKEKLKSPEGRFLMRMRGQDVETVFADRKYINGMDRFLLRGLKKVRIESGFFYSAHNIRKIYRYLLDNWLIISNKGQEIKLIA